MITVNIVSGTQRHTARHKDVRKCTLLFIWKATSSSENAPTRREDTMANVFNPLWQLLRFCPSGKGAGWQGDDEPDSQRINNLRKGGNQSNEASYR